MSLYKTIVFPILKKFDAEKVHYWSTGMLQFACKIPGVSSLLRNAFTLEDPRLEKTLFGIKFKNPVGLAAGFDKNALWIDELENLGFGFIEIGTLTPKAQDGNPKPRLFRLPEDGGIINRMGFNNGGVELAIQSLRKRKSKVIVGGNIGKNKVTPNENATEDYIIAFNALFDYVDYFVVNVSSPNTPGLRELQDKEPLTKLLSTLKNINVKKDSPKPILLKIAPDLSNEQLDDIVQIVADTKIEGIIATNTTIERGGLQTSNAVVEKMGAGGLSGSPLKDRSTAVIAYLHKKSNGSFPIIGVGGIRNGADVKEKLAAGASLVQVYSGFIYEGPAMVKNICEELLEPKA
ncbi:dihydroorotate oxidase A [Spirosomataceae bacterium TFI 002]|nr:dihydroorotate oxidase A [Spirosomataceae bacterium TFI 002]